MTKGGQSRDAECILSPVCSQRVQNLETETSKNSTTKRKRRDLPSASAWLRIAPDPVNQQQTEQALSFLRLLSSRPTAAPWLLLSVCVRWGGDPSSVVNIYNPNYSSHPTQQQRHAVGRQTRAARLLFTAPPLCKHRSPPDDCVCAARNQWRARRKFSPPCC